MTEIADADAVNPCWVAVLRGDRDAFRALVAARLGDLFEAARRELRYRTALGDLDAGELTPEELVGDVLVRAWQDRQRRPPHVGLAAWLLATLFRVVTWHVRRARRLKALAGPSLETTLPPGPIYDDDEEFWEWYQPDEILRWEDVVRDAAATPEAEAAVDEALTRALDPRARELLLLSAVHDVPLREAAAALGLSSRDVTRLLSTARRGIDHMLGRSATAP
jgi:RNA polymerase sigma-70 factor (ECF subfamily)